MSTQTKLATPTDMSGSNTKTLTIGDLTIDQLRVALWRALNRQRDVDKGLIRACRELDHIMP